MNPTPAIRLTLLAGAAFMLQGCLVAALPVIAGGALAGRDVVRERQEDRASQNQSAPPTGEVRVADAASAAAAPPSTTTSTIRETTASEQDWRVSELTALPAPTGADVATSGSAPGTYNAFASYALAQAALEPKKARSAVLANPGSLDGKRAECGAEPRAVLIDLDPESRLFALDGAGPSDPALAAKLDNLRRQDVTVGWISGRLMIDAERIRERLAASGLDPLGEDTLLLMNSFDERKQTRRATFASDYCLVAIAGDTMSDFDELFEYIKNENMATRLFALRNAGWFITPPPITKTPLATAPMTQE